MSHKKHKPPNNKNSVTTHIGDLKKNIIKGLLLEKPNELKNSETADFSYCQHFKPSSISNTFGNRLKVLSLDYCVQIRDIDLYEIAKNNPNLMKISLKGCSRITGKGIRALVSTAKNLTEISISECSQFSYNVVAYIAISCNSRLRKLDISCCDKINNKAVPFLAHYCKNLKVLNIKRTGLDANGVKALITKGCTNLMELNVDGLCVNDSTLKSFVVLRNTLEVLDISWCMFVTFHGLKAVVRGMKRLRLLSCWGIDLPEEKLVSVENEYSSLKLKYRY